MDFGLLINSLPIWAVFVISLAATSFSVEIGTRVAASLRAKSADPEAPVGSLVTAMLGLLAFLLAFTFGMTMSRFDARRQLLLNESNAVGTTYLRARLLPAEQGKEIQRLLREYVDLRLSATQKNLPEVLRHSEEIHEQLWRQTEVVATKEMDSAIRMLFISSLNEMIDLHESRKIVGLFHRIPGMVWFSLCLLSVLSMFAMGYQIGVAGSRRIRGSYVLSASLSLVIAMIADVERPGEGQFRIDQQPLQDVRQTMQVAK